MTDSRNLDNIPYCYPDETENCIPMPENRIDPTGGPIIAVNSAKPAQGGWAPPPWAPAAVAVYCGIAASVAPLLLALGPGGIIGAAILAGSAAGLGGYFGVKSAGPRKTE